MKKYPFRFTLFLTLMLVASSAVAGARKVLLIGIDGVQAEALRHSKIPTLQWLQRNGFGTFSSWHQDITISGPSWSSILCGVYHPKHGVKDNHFDGKNYGQFPMLPKIGKFYDSHLTFGMYMEWAKLFKHSKDQLWDQMIRGRMMGTDHTAENASNWIRSTNLDFYFVYFGKADYVGHATGFSRFNPLYRWALQDIDKGVAQLLHAMWTRDQYTEEDWLVLLTTDHGGAFHDHGGLSDKEREVFWIAYSDQIRKNDVCGIDGGNINDLCNPYKPWCKWHVPVQPDIAVTALHHLLYDTICDVHDFDRWKFDGVSWLDAIGLCRNKVVSPQIALCEMQAFEGCL